MHPRSRDTGPWAIRPARPGDHVALSALALRSAQRAWNYPDDFMAWDPEAITVAPEDIAGAVVRVLDEGDRPIGFSMLRGDPPEIELSRLFVEPDATGAGAGRALWDDAVETARQLGAEVMTLDADPNAESFYLRMGAVTTGVADWEPPMMPGWRVRLMRYAIPPAGQRDQAGVASSPDSR
jgi:GNAT superfamily N-acetyltransferase